MRWEDIIGHQENIGNVKRMITAGKVTHALLFSGPAGVGKALTAATLAAALLCEQANGDICGQCLSCRQMQRGTHPDYFFISPDGTTVKIEQIRALQREAALAAYLGMYKVFIIDEADLMTKEAANSMLKVLEEPPEKVVFVLVTARRHLLLPTIISRCRLFAFSPLALSQLTEVLVERGTGEEQAVVASRLSGGRIGIALRFLEPGGMARRDEAASVFFRLAGANMMTIWELAAAQEKAVRADVVEVLSHLTIILRDMLLLLSCRDESFLLNADLAGPFLEETHRWTEEGLLTAIKEVKAASRAIHANANIRLTWEALLIKLTECAD